ncbi:MAG: hypothetical protein HYZ50_18445 [Deltaproteobacteria bacterium]|nr:hypothetical protein [Deltaproteobacteria bacterium]
MNGTLLDQVAQLQQDLRLVQSTVEALQAKVDALVAPLQEQVSAQGRRPVRFAELEGIWEGMDLSLEAIKAAEYRMPENLL